MTLKTLTIAVLIVLAVFVEVLFWCFAISSSSDSIAKEHVKKWHIVVVFLLITAVILLFLADLKW